MAALIGLLNVPSFLLVCTGGVFSAVPPNTLAPYAKIVIRERTAPLSTFGAMNPSLDARVGLYSSYLGSKELDDMALIAVPLVHHAVPTIAGFQNPLIEYVGSSELDDVLVNGETVRGRQLTFDVALVQA